MQTKLLNENVAGQVRKAFESLTGPVSILFFGQKDGCELCADTLQLLEEVVDLSDLLSLSVYDLDEDRELARQYRVDKAPTLVLAGWDGDEVLDFGIRIAGIPSGHEFSSLIHDLILVSGRDSGLDPKTRAFLKGLDRPVLLQVFVTPT